MLLVTSQSEHDMRSKDDSCTVDEHNKKFIRVVLPDESTTVFYAKPSTTLRAAIAKLCERRNLDLDLIDVYNHNTGKVRVDHVITVCVLRN